MLEFILTTPYGHSLIVLSSLVALMIFSLFNQRIFMFYGTMILMAWIGIEVYFVVTTEYLWSYLGFLMAAALMTYLLWFLMLFPCEKFGKMYRGDGGLIGLVPLTMFPVFMIIAIFIRGVGSLWNFLFG